MKRVISLMLCLLMLVPMFASCSEEEELETIETATREAVTISMYVITEDETKPEASQAVEDAIKSIIKSKYTTNLEIEFITEDDYYSTVEARLEGMKKDAEKKAEESKKAEKDDTDTGDEETEEAVTTEATIINEYGVTELKYPDLGANQIDIFMIADYDKYLEYAEGGWLYNLNDTIKNASKKLTDYIYPTILDSALVKGNYYAVPNNMPIGGESTYMIIDKTLAEEFGLDTAKVDSVHDLKAFFAWVKENKADITPLAGYYEDISARYMGVSDATRSFTSDFSLVGDFGSSESTISEAVSLFENESYKKEILSLGEMYYAGYFGAQDSENFAAAIKTGDIISMAEYSENYDIVVLESETKPANELCTSMFAVSKHTAEFTRVMEVITLLNTSDTIRNLLQYGIENVNYELDETTGALRRMNNDYMMDLYKTGNVYMAYPEEGMPLDIWDIAKKQNLASGNYAEDVFGGFVLPEDTPEELDPESGEVTKEAFTVDMTTATDLANASAEVLRTLANAATYEEFEAAVNGVAEKYADIINAFLDKNNANAPYALYVAQ